MDHLLHRLMVDGISQMNRSEFVSGEAVRHRLLTGKVDGLL